jgi:galactokinase
MNQTMTESTTDHIIYVNAPGRINLIGEHTDYNDGYAMPAAVDKSIQFKISKNKTSDLCTVEAKDFKAKTSFYLYDLKHNESSWVNYVLGVISEIQKLTNNLGAFHCEISSTLPVGSGMSSSAALECGFATALNELFDLGFSKREIINIAYHAERNFVGTKCGIMDQFASVMGKKDKLLFLDCKTLDYQSLSLNIAPYELVLLNTGVSHSLLDGDYNNRQEQCYEGVSKLKASGLKIEALRSVTELDLERNKAVLSDQVYKRVLYVVQENQRVLDAKQAILDDDIFKLGALMYETHKGLSELYEVSCEELDFLVEFSKDDEAVIGSRMMGGGFGGCTINLVHSDFTDNFTNAVKTAYKKQFPDLNLETYKVSLSNGTSKYNP